MYKSVPRNECPRPNCIFFARVQKATSMVIFSTDDTEPQSRDESAVLSTKQLQWNNQGVVKISQNRTNTLPAGQYQ